MDVPPYSSQSIHLALACYVLIFPWVSDVWEIVLWNSRIFWFYFSKPACCSVSLSLSFIESSNSSSNMCESGSSANLSKSLHCLLKKKTHFLSNVQFLFGMRYNFRFIVDRLNSFHFFTIISIFLRNVWE